MRGGAASSNGLNPRIQNLLAKQQFELTKNPANGIIFYQNEDGDVTDIQADIIGPVQTAYEGGIFRCKLVIESGFPQSAPKGYFLTKIFHPNVAPKTGEICVNTLKRDWNPSKWSLKHIFEVIKCLLIVPFPESSLNEEAGREFMDDYQSFCANASVITQIHAKPNAAQKQLIKQRQQEEEKQSATSTEQQKPQLTNQQSATLSNNRLQGSGAAQVVSSQMPPFSQENNSLVVSSQGHQLLSLPQSQQQQQQQFSQGNQHHNSIQVPTHLISLNQQSTQHQHAVTSNNNATFLIPTQSLQMTATSSIDTKSYQQVGPQAPAFLSQSTTDVMDEESKVFQYNGDNQLVVTSSQQVLSQLTNQQQQPSSQHHGVGFIQGGLVKTGVVVGHGMIINGSSSLGSSALPWKSMPVQSIGGASTPSQHSAVDPQCMTENCANLSQISNNMLPSQTSQLGYASGQHQQTQLPTLTKRPSVLYKKKVETAKQRQDRYIRRV